MSDLPAHVVEARKAATHILWAACAGAPMSEAVKLMQIAAECWPEKPLMVGAGGPLADSPSAQAWENAAVALQAAKAAQGAHLGIEWEQRVQVEQVVAAGLRTLRDGLADAV